MLLRSKVWRRSGGGAWMERCVLSAGDRSSGLVSMVVMMVLMVLMVM